MVSEVISKKLGAEQGSSPLQHQCRLQSIARACEHMSDIVQAAKMLQIGAKVLDNVRMGAKPIVRAKASAAAVKAPRDGSQPERQPEQEKKLVSEPR